MELTSGKIQKAQRIVIYGPEGIGKSTLANQFPKPVFIDTEGGTNWMEAHRFTCTSWQDILKAVEYLKTKKHEFQTVVFDTADWTERFCVQHLCTNANKKSIEDFGYGKGYTYLAEEFGGLLTSLNTLIDAGIHIIFIGHCTVKKMELPEQEGSFDHYELKCTKQTSPLLKEWAEAVLFVNFKVLVTQDENKRTKAVGGRKRIIHTQHTAAYDAKNRWGLPDKVPFDLPFDFSVFAKVLNDNPRKSVKTDPPSPPPIRPKLEAALKDGTAVMVPPLEIEPEKKPEKANGLTAHQRQILTLMEKSKITKDELKKYSVGKSFIPEKGQLSDLDSGIMKQMVTEKNWLKVVANIEATRK